MADRFWKGVYPLVFGHSHQLSLTDFFDPSTTSMKKGRERGEKKGVVVGVVVVFVFVFVVIIVGH